MEETKTISSLARYINSSLHRMARAKKTPTELATHQLTPLHITSHHQIRQLVRD